MTKTISTTQLRAEADVLEEVNRGERYLVTHYNKPYVAIVPVPDLEQLEGNMTQPIASESGPRHVVTNEDGAPYTTDTLMTKVERVLADLAQIISQVSRENLQLRAERDALRAELEALRAKQEGTP